VVLAAALGAMSSSMLIYSLGVFVEPLQRSFGWSRVEIMAGPATNAIICLLLAPFVGVLADRVGMRRIGIAGATAVGILTTCLVFVGPAAWTWMAAWAVLGVAFSFTLPFVWTGAVSGFFNAGRGLAMGLTLSGSSLSALLVPLLSYYLIERFGWWAGFLGLGGFTLLVIVPVLLLFLSSAHDHARLGRPPLKAVAATTTAWRSQIMTRRFIQIAIGALLAAAVGPALVANIVPVLVSGGIPRGESAGIASLVGLASLGGRVGIGWLLDRFDGRKIAAAVVCMPMITASVLIAAPDSLAAATVAVVFLGIAMGAESDMTGYLTSRYFELGHFGKLFGIVTGLVVLGGAGGPLLFSAVYDSVGSYVPALWAVIPLCPVAALMFLTLGRYPRLAAEP
jgi:MFS family permease